MASLLDHTPVLPVVVVDDVDVAVPLARALLRGGIAMMEVTLRSDDALNVVRTIADQVPEMTVGVGTVCTADQIKLAVDAGARFLSGPGATDRLLDALQASELPFLVGTATTSEMLRLLERGVTDAKLFPASVVGGVALLRAVYGPLPQLRFCATGGISAGNAAQYLALPNVGCVGGTWIAPQRLVDARDWDAISHLAAQAAALG